MSWVQQVHNAAVVARSQAEALGCQQSKFTMLFALNYIKETMYYWGVNSKMQTPHTLCSRPKRYGALHCGTLATTVP